jgi:hypothetical protein
MPELRTSLVIDLAGNLQRRALAAQRAVGGIGRSGTAQFSQMNRAMSRSSSGLLAMGSRAFAVIGGAIAVRSAARAAMATEERLERLGVQANRSTDQVQALWDRIASPDVALNPNINVDPKKVLAAVEQIVEMTGDLAFAEANMASLARAIQATGAEGEAIGGLAAELQKMGLAPREVAVALDNLTAKGKEGAFTLGNLAALGPRIFAAYAATGRGGLKAVDELGAVLQVIRMGTGSAEQATTAFEAMLRTLQDADKVKFLTRSGIRVFEDDGTTMRAIDELMQDIVRATGGDPLKLSAVFDAEAMRAFNTMNAGFRRTGGFSTLDRMRAAQGRGQLEADAARIAKTTSAVTDAAASAVGKKIEEAITPAMKEGAEFLRRAMEQGVTSALEREVAEIETRRQAGRYLDRGLLPPVSRVPQSVLDAEAAQAQQRGPEGTVTIRVQAEAGTRARVTGLEGRGLDVDTGSYMPEGR